MPSEMPTALALFFLLASPFVGSFLAVLVMRLPKNADVVLERSRCDRCRAKLGPTELIPIVSWIALRGKCKHCKQALSPIHPFTEISAIVVAIISWAAMPGWLFPITCLLGWALLTLAFIDWRDFLLPDIITLPLIPAGLAIAYPTSTLAFTDHLFGMLFGAGCLWAVGALYKSVRKLDGLGLGDVKLFAAAGAWLGWQNLPNVLLLASIGALVVVLIMHLNRAPVTGTTPIPFGTPLAASFFAVWLLNAPVFYS